MRIAYGMNRTPKDFAGLDCDRMFLDDSTTRRGERAEMHNLRFDPGDALVLLARGDLGAGREVTQIIGEIKAQGAAVEVHETPKATRGRPKSFDPSEEQERVLRPLWHSTLPLAHVLRRASEVMGFEVKRHQMIYQFKGRWKK